MAGRVEDGVDHGYDAHGADLHQAARAERVDPFVALLDEDHLNVLGVVDRGSAELATVSMPSTASRPEAAFCCIDSQAKSSSIGARLGLFSVGVKSAIRPEVLVEGVLDGETRAAAFKFYCRKQLSARYAASAEPCSSSDPAKRDMAGRGVTPGGRCIIGDVRAGEVHHASEAIARREQDSTCSSDPSLDGRNSRRAVGTVNRERSRRRRSPLTAPAWERPRSSAAPSSCPMQRMTGNRRHLLTGLMLALHATTSPCGPGHHGLEGTVGIFRREASGGTTASTSQGSAWSSDEECPACVHGLMPTIASAAVPSPRAGDPAAASPTPATIDPGSGGQVVSRPRAPPSPA